MTDSLAVRDLKINSLVLVEELQNSKILNK